MSVEEVRVIEKLDASGKVRVLQSHVHWAITAIGLNWQSTYFHRSVGAATSKNCMAEVDDMYVIENVD